MQARFSICLTNQKKIWIREDSSCSYAQYSNKVGAQQSRKAEHHAKQVIQFHMDEDNCAMQYRTSRRELPARDPHQSGCWGSGQRAPLALFFF
jgi:hypothetical protein